MRYKNTKTGAIFDSPCVISGGDWTAYVEEIAAVKEEVADKTIEVKVEENHDEITVREIKQELDAFGIKYDPKAKKQELYDLMMNSRK